MRVIVTPTDPSMAAEGFALFRGAYLRARRASPLLPELTVDHETRLRGRVERAFAHGGVAAWRGDALVGPLYAAVADRLRHAGVPLHLIGHFTADRATTSQLFELGFGAVVRERLRDLSDVVAADAARPDHQAWLARVERVPQAAPWDGLAPLAAEHAAFYRRSPLFVVTSTPPRRRSGRSARP